MSRKSDRANQPMTCARLECRKRQEKQPGFPRSSPGFTGVKAESKHCGFIVSIQRIEEKIFRQHSLPACLRLRREGGRRFKLFFRFFSDNLTLAQAPPAMSLTAAGGAALGQCSQSPSFAAPTMIASASLALRHGTAPASSICLILDTASRLLV